MTYLGAGQSTVGRSAASVSASAPGIAARRALCAGAAAASATALAEFGER